MEGRKLAILRTVRGVLTAALVTLGMMAAIAALVVASGMKEDVLFLLNQAAKILSIFAGVYAAVGAGGEKGFITGAAVGLLYMCVGYGMYYALNGGVAAPLVMLGEMLLGGILGALFGAITANLSPGKRRKRA